MNTYSNEVLVLFKALSDKNRLKIIGLLAERPKSVEEISGALRVSPSTASHHLAVLGKAGLVSGRVQGYYNMYSLHTERIDGVAKELLHRVKPTPSAVEEAVDDYDRKVLTVFTDEEGRITAFPVQERKYLVLLRFVLKKFERGIRYSEKEVNQILSQFNRDTARLRRSLVEYKFMAREGGGGDYWRTDKS